ncbi:MAG: hypothetical protein ABI621_15790 [Chloroflexota bacterium]
MKLKNVYLVLLLILTTLSCSVSNPGLEPTPSPSPSAAATNTSTGIPHTETSSPIPPTETFTSTPTLTLTFTPLPTETVAPSPYPSVESLNAKVTADRLSCRYGPGPEYLYLFAFRATANIKLIGRVDADNWDWVLVENQVKCWVSAQHLEVAGDIKSLPAMYPEGVKLPVTPYYPPSAVLSATRNNNTNEVTVTWVEIPVSLGDYEDDSMQTYIIETWRCEGGQLVFDPLATRFTFITFIDEAGCSQPSHGRVFVQEKHGYAGPAEIPWPPLP